ncbi:hypothetical protein MTO96_044884, partial [Rhipicephalus appendiculatus]
MAVPVLYPRPQYQLESPESPGIVRTPPTKRRDSSRTHSKTNIKVQRPLLPPGHELVQHAQARSPVTSPRQMMTQPHSSTGSPVEVVSPQGSRVGYSFDSE